MSLTGPVVVCEIDLDLLTAKYSTKTTFRAIPRFPSSSRDVAFLIRLGVEAGELLRTATDSAEELLEKVQIFDVYEGKTSLWGRGAWDCGFHIAVRTGP